MLQIDRSRYVMRGRDDTCANTFVLDMRAERFAEAPTVETDAIDKVKDAKWREQNDAYYLAANQ